MDCHTPCSISTLWRAPRRRRCTRPGSKEWSRRPPTRTCPTARFGTRKPWAAVEVVREATAAASVAAAAAGLWEGATQRCACSSGGSTLRNRSARSRPGTSCSQGSQSCCCSRSRATCHRLVWPKCSPIGPGSASSLQNGAERRDIGCMGCYGIVEGRWGAGVHSLGGKAVTV